MSEARPAVSDSEREVLEVLWEHGPAAVREVHERLARQGSQWSRSTVITLLQRLEKKGYVASDKSGFAFTFRPTVTREELGHQRLRELADELFEGKTAPLLLAFARRERFTRDEIKELRRLIDELARESKRGR